MIKMIDVDKIPEKPVNVLEILDTFMESGKNQVMLDLTDVEQAKQVVYNRLYNAIKSRDLNIKITQAQGNIYLQRTNEFKVPLSEINEKGERIVDNE